MSQMPPSSAQINYLPPQARQTNVPAIISLITGILSCVPFISLIAVITGIIGLSKAKNPAVGGKGLAIAGLILGAIGLLWTIAAGGLYVARRHAIQTAMNSPAHTLAKQFLADVASGNTASVMADCDANVDATKVDAIVADAKTWGTLSDSTLFATPAGKSGNGVETSMVAGVAIYSNAKKTVTVTVINPSNSPKISDFTFSNQNGSAIPTPTTMTTTSP